ncbi:MAG: esterase [Zetaproteobacteria bacterium]|nr:MAG: esterase [Zetaproteobacteria bacterium]
MDIEKLTRDPELNAKLDALRAYIDDDAHAISDVIDDAGHQYIDLVMEGGGMLGLALVGYTWALERMNIRFLGIGGTSAGSINALLLAALDMPAHAKSQRVLHAIESLNFFDFVDGGPHAQGLIKAWLDTRRPAWRRIPGALWHLLRVKHQLCSNYGLNKGDAFQHWLEHQLSEAGIATLRDLNNRLAQPPKGLRLRDRKAFPGPPPHGRLAIIATDITTETRVTLPDMASLYWSQPERVSPAQFARASMSIPLFFEPMRVGPVPHGPLAEQRWRKLAGYDRLQDPSYRIPDTAMFVDGGVVSNFPIDVFHNHRAVPTRPTFGVKLQYDQRYKPPARLPVHSDGHWKRLVPLVGAIFNSARHTLDYEFIKKHPDFRHLVQHIPCTYREHGKTKSYNWLDFNMSDSHKAGLFRQGAERAIAFVTTFSHPVDNAGQPCPPAQAAFSSKWIFYKALRRSLANRS